MAVTVEDVRAKSVQVADEIVDDGFGLTTQITVPGAGQMTLHEPRRAVAYAL